MSSIGRPLPSLQVSKRAKQPFQRHNQQNRIVKGGSTGAKTASSSSTNLIQQPSLLGQILERYSPSPMQQQQEPQPDTIHQPMRLDNNTSELTGSLPNRMVHTSHMLYISPPSTPSSPFLSFPAQAPPSPYLPFISRLIFYVCYYIFAHQAAYCSYLPFHFSIIVLLADCLAYFLKLSIYLQMTNIEFAEHCINMDPQQAFSGSSIAEADTRAEITTGITFETLDSATESQSSSGIVHSDASLNIIFFYPYILPIILHFSIIYTLLDFLFCPTLHTYFHISL